MLDDIKDINDNLSIMDSDWGFNIYNSGCHEYGVNVRFDEIVVLRDALNKIIDSRPRLIMRNGDE